MDVVVDRSSVSERYASLTRTAGVLGLTSMVLLFVPIIVISTAEEPPLEAIGEEAARFFENSSTQWMQVVSAGPTIGMISTLWFFVALGFLLARAEGNPPWRATIATLSAGLVAAYGVIDSSWQAASLHGEKITPQLADYAFAVGNLGFANVWLAMASFSLCSGWVILSTRVLERWMGWWIVVAGLGLVVARFTWTSELWTLPYMLFWVWVLMLSIRLLRRPSLLDPVET